MIDIQKLAEEGDTNTKFVILGMMMQMHDKQLISSETLLRIFGFDPDEEKKKVEAEYRGKV